MKLEVWKDIENYLNYQISNFGNVKSKSRHTNQRNGLNLRKEKMLKHQIDRKGYHYVRLYNDKGWKYFKVHRLVAEAFIQNIDNEPTIDHIDRNKDNNCVENLRWASNILQANNKDKTNIIKHCSEIGKLELPNRAKPVKRYSLDNLLLGVYPSARVASIKTNIGETSISNCINGYSKTAGGYIWTH